MSHAGGAHSDWPVPEMESPTERRRRQRREYYARRVQKLAAGEGAGTQWTAEHARIAVNLTLTALQAGAQVGRSANAVQSLRRRWRNGSLPTTLAAHLPDPPPPSTSRRPRPTERK